MTLPIAIAAIESERGPPFVVSLSNHNSTELDFAWLRCGVGDSLHLDKFGALIGSGCCG